MKTRNGNTQAVMIKVLGVLAVALFALMIPQQAQAQLPSIATPVVAPTPVAVNYSFDLPVAKVVPNPCTNGSILVTGSMNVKIATTEGGSGFGFTLALNSSGKGEDAKPDSTLLFDGTQKPKYVYSSTTSGDADFPRRPADFSLELPISDGLFREFSDNSDAVVMETKLQLNFVNGVPSAPVIKGFNLRCTK
jgi:hypothetical protein